jgi:hypothetical protein
MLVLCELNEEVLIPCACGIVWNLFRQRIWIVVVLELTWEQRPLEGRWNNFIRATDHILYVSTYLKVGNCREIAYSCVSTLLQWSSRSRVSCSVPSRDTCLVMHPLDGVNKWAHNGEVVCSVRVFYIRIYVTNVYESCWDDGEDCRANSLVVHVNSV